MSRVWRLAAMLLLAFAAAPMLAQMPPACVACGSSPLAGTVYKHAKGLICESCYHLPSRCSLCGLPVKDGYGKTGDGRFICKIDLPQTVMAESQARQVFEESKNGLYRISGGALTLRFPEVAVSLFDVDYWNVKDGNPVPESLRRSGFSQSRSSGSQIAHAVVLLSGQWTEDLKTTCAHEFMHLWINEQKAQGRVIDSDSLEALCELGAYKWADLLNMTLQQRRILDNPYTNGKINEVLELDAQFGFNAILEWVKRSTNATFDATGLVQLGAERINAIATAYRVAAPKAIPDRLRLMGIMGASNNRRALINDRIFMAKDEKEMQVGEKIFKVKCLEIKASSVVLSINGASVPVTLSLSER